EAVEVTTLVPAVRGRAEDADDCRQRDQQDRAPGPRAHGVHRFFATAQTLCPTGSESTRSRRTWTGRITRSKKRTRPRDCSVRPRTRKHYSEERTPERLEY